MTDNDPFSKQSLTCFETLKPTRIVLDAHTWRRRASAIRDLHNLRVGSAAGAVHDVVSFISGWLTWTHGLLENDRTEASPGVGGALARQPSITPSLRLAASTYTSCDREAASERLLWRQDLDQSDASMKVK